MLSLCRWAFCKNSVRLLEEDVLYLIWRKEYFLLSHLVLCLFQVTNPAQVLHDSLTRDSSVPIT
jgi:hypothetical protein